MDKLFIHDTTLRDGAQASHVVLTKEQRVEIAMHLALLRVDVIEAGFSAAGPIDFDTVVAASQTVKDTVVCAFARATPNDVELAALALAKAERGRLFTGIATSDLHMQVKLRMSRDQVLDRVRSTVRLARSLMGEVAFGFEDATRSDFDFLVKVVDTAIASGATTITLADTVGWCVGDEYEIFMRKLRQEVANSDLATFSTHCHDDLGHAVANSLGGIKGGARQVECTLNGLGDRAGNAALEEVVMALRTRPEQFGTYSTVETGALATASEVVARLSGIPVSPNKAIVGANCFRHTSGIHQDGMLKNPETYQIIDPTEVGREMEIVIGPLSGRSGISAKLAEMGIELTDGQLERACQQIKALQKSLDRDALLRLAAEL
jgi:2-isopropylmalate synthase